MKDKPIPYAKDKDMNYENFIATCPHCGFQNIFNRVSDLETVEPIGFKQVICLNSSCKKQFNINGDLVSENYAYLIMDCYDLLKNKRYMYCILNLCQACEMFFVRAIEVKLIYQPFKDKVLPDDCDQLNDLCKKLHTKIKDYPFKSLQRVFFDLYLNDKVFQSLKSIEDYINTIDCRKNKTPQDAEIDLYPNIKARELFKKMKLTKINELRNHVVHKYGYRPDKLLVERNLENIREVIFGLVGMFQIKHILSYLN